VPPAQSADNLLLLDNWTSYQTSTYKEWVVLVTHHATSTCKTDILRLMAPLCAVKVSYWYNSSTCLENVTQRSQNLLH